jgi:F420H(2)-dependent quinone reductase
MKTRPNGLDSPVVPKMMKVASQANVAIYRATKGRVLGTWRVGSAFRKGVPMCLLTHTGRKSGRTLVSPLLFLSDGDRVILVASQGGLPKHPQWYHNIKANPDVTIQIRGEIRPMRARVADQAERAVLWPRLVDLYADFASYQSWTERVIPVIVCEPR